MRACWPSRIAAAAVLLIGGSVACPRAAHSQAKPNPNLPLLCFECIPAPGGEGQRCVLVGGQGTGKACSEWMDWKPECAWTPWECYQIWFCQTSVECAPGPPHIESASDFLSPSPEASQLLLAVQATELRPSDSENLLVEANCRGETLSAQVLVAGDRWVPIPR